MLQRRYRDITMNYKERPRCKIIIEGLLKQGYTLEGLDKKYLSRGLRIQVQKMLLEKMEVKENGN